MQDVIDVDVLYWQDVDVWDVVSSLLEVCFNFSVVDDQGVVEVEFVEVFDEGFCFWFEQCYIVNNDE